MPQYSSNPRDINIASPGVTQGEMLARLQQALLQQQIDDAELSGPAAKAARTQMRLSDPIEAMNTQDQIRRFSIRRDIAPQPIKGVRAAPVSMNPADFPMAGARGPAAQPGGMPVLRGVRRVTEGEPAAPKPVTTAFGTSTPRTTARSFGTGGLSSEREAADLVNDPNYEAGLKARRDEALTTPAVIAAGARGGLTGHQSFTQARALQGDYQKVTATAQEMQRQLGLMDQGLEAAKRGDLNAGSQAVLVTFQKILDPSSVVRESEYARSPEGMGILQRIQGAAQRVAQGGPGVPPAELEKFAALARQMTEGVTASAQLKAKGILDLAEASGIDPQLVMGAGIVGADGAGSAGTRGTETPAATGTSGTPKVGDTKVAKNGKRLTFDGNGWTDY